MPNESLKQLLHYMEDTTYENAVNEELRELHRMVETVKKDPEVGGMRIQIVEDVIRLSEENVKLTEENTKKTEEITRQTEEITKKTEEITRQTEEITKLTEEIMKLREELGQKNIGEKAAGKAPKAD